MKLLSLSAQAQYSNNLKKKMLPFQDNEAKKQGVSRGILSYTYTNH